MIVPVALVAAAAAAVANAQAACKPDLLVDDFAAARTVTLPEGGGARPANLLNGDYGAQGATFAVNPAGKEVVITAGTADVGQPEPQANPGTAPTFNYWFGKFDIGACFDLTGYTAIAFDLVAPAGSNMNFTLTQRSADCKTRLVDSVYKPLSSYLKTDGSKKAVSLPIADYAKNLKGGAFDFKHLKDWTIVNMTPSGAVFRLSNLRLVGNCAGNQTATTTTTAASKSTATASASATVPSVIATQKPATGSAQSAGASIGAALVAVLAAMSF
ncbi:hypothetical protein BC831DRAFT_476493 [Entophlyctis helioformis]|nr:hypothetical protein BC831DRAFT_476493 [Entophlyctis helioformis]